MRAERTIDVACAADLCVDMILRGNVVPRFGQVEQLIDDYALELGGSATIFAGQFARLGGAVSVIGAVGDDPFGAVILERLGELGVDHGRVRQRADVKTGLGVSLVKPDGDRAMLTLLGGISAVSRADLSEDLLSHCRHWHLASYFLLDGLRDAWPDWLRACRAAGVTTSLDTNWDPEERWEGVLDLLPLIDVFLPNDQEACAIAGEADVVAAGRRLASYGPVVVVKRGADGATAFHRDTHCDLPPLTEAERPREIVDTVGAGDNFDAGFLRSWLLGRGITASLALGDRCARGSLAHAGGFRGQLRERVA